MLSETFKLLNMNCGQFRIDTKKLEIYTIQLITLVLVKRSWTTVPAYFSYAVLFGFKCQFK